MFVLFSNLKLFKFISETLDRSGVNTKEHEMIELAEQCVRMGISVDYRQYQIKIKDLEDIYERCQSKFRQVTSVNRSQLGTFINIIYPNIIKKQ